MSGASTSHTTWSTYLFRLLVLLAGALVLVMLSPGQARADGLGGVTDAAGDSVGSIVTTTTEAVGQVVSSTGEAVQQTAATVSTAVHDAVSSTDAGVRRIASSAAQTIHQVLRSAGRAANDHHRGHRPPVLPSVAHAVAGPPTDRPHPHHNGHQGQRGVPPHHHGVGVAPPPVTTGVVRTALQPSNSSQATATEASGPAPPPRGRPVPRGSSGGATVPVGGGSRDPGGRGEQLAAILVAALVLARASSRWLRLLAVARGPTPIVPILVPPG
jgi:hypothetical protein